MSQNFAERTVRCRDCRVDATNAIDTMEQVILGNRDPDTWWCLRHRARFEWETREYRTRDETGRKRIYRSERGEI